MVDDEDAKMLAPPHDYQYYPSTLYEPNPPTKSEGTLPLPERRTVKEEFPGPASIATGWQIGGCGRYTGMESSRGYYPDVHAHTGY
jgi:meiosis-specific transcription factor NDT80